MKSNFDGAQIDVKRVLDFIKKNHFEELVLSHLETIGILNYQDFTTHNIEHAVHVGVFSQILASFYALNESDKNILLDAALLHDLGRIDDSYDFNHGVIGAILAENILEEQPFYDEEKLKVVKMLIESHNTNLYDLSVLKKYNCYSAKNILLLKILKDADLLDMFRLDNKEVIHINNLFLKESKMLIAFARYWNQHPELIGILKEVKNNGLSKN